jgi:hypothetical protein
VECITKVTTKIRKDAKLGPWKNIPAALITVWKADKLEAISKQLDLYRQQLILRILVILEARSASQAAHLDNRFDRLERANQQVIEVIAINQTKTRDAKESQANALVSTQDNEGVDSQQRQAKTIAAILTFKDGATQILSTDPPEDNQQFHESNVQTALTLRRKAKEGLYDDCVGTAGTASLVNFASGSQKILNSLFFRHMDHRYEEVAVAHQKTFDWIFDDETSDVPWDNLANWLKSGSGCYWIDGKAGSGKSTLLKYISEHAQTWTSLRTWAGGRELTVSSFYFWNLGSPLQKSQSGLLRALLFNLLEPRPQLVPLAFPGLCRAALTKNADLSEPTLVELKKATNLLVQQTKNTMRLCFLIDGIDEYDGDHAEMSTFVKSLAAYENVKIIVSSRPIPACVEVFLPLPHLRLQDLTYNDIQVYVQDTLKSHPNMKKLESCNRAQTQDLVTEITKKASGVFLWVFLVVKSLLEGLRNYDRIEDLEARLQELPADLENLYQHMLNGVRPSYRNQAGRMLQIVLRSVDTQQETHALTALQFSFAEEYDYEDAVSALIAPISDLERRGRREEVEGRIRSRCCGLLELYGRRHRKLAATDTAEPTIGFLHKTVAEFLRQPHFHLYHGEQLMQSGIDISLSSSCLLMVKTMKMGISTLSNHHSLLQYTDYCLRYMTSLSEDHITTEVALFQALDAAITVQLDTLQSGLVTHSCGLAQAPQHWSLQMIDFLSQPIASGYSSGRQQQRTGIVVLTACYGGLDLARIIFQSANFCRDDLANILGQLMLSLFEGTLLHGNLSYNLLHEAFGRRRQHLAEIIKMALQHGADPNEKCAFEGNRTHWNGLKEVTALDSENVAHKRQLKLFERSTQLCSAWELLLAFMAGLRPTFLNTCCSWPCTACTSDRQLILDLVETLLDNGIDSDAVVSSRVEVGEDEETYEASSENSSENEVGEGEETHEASNENSSENEVDEGEETHEASNENSSENERLVTYRKSALGVLKQAVNHILQPPPRSKGSVLESLHASSQRILAKMVEQGAVDQEWRNGVLIVKSPQYTSHSESTTRSDQSLPETAKTLTHEAGMPLPRSSTTGLNPFTMLTSWWSTRAK